MKINNSERYCFICIQLNISFISPDLTNGILNRRVYTLYLNNGLDYLIVFGTTFWNFGSSMLFTFVLVWLYKYFDMSVTDESYVDATRVWRTKL